MLNGSLVGAREYVEFFAFLCCIVGITFFGGTTRESLVDKDNLRGLLLLGLALLTHGGFESLLRSSPDVIFSGYILGYRNLPNDAWISVYDLGYPPQGFETDGPAWYNSPSRVLYIGWSKRNVPPESFLKIDRRYRITCVYRSWDLKITSVHAIPIPQAEAQGFTSWQWEAPTPMPRFWFLTEAVIGAISLVSSMFILLRTPKPIEPTFDEFLRSTSGKA